MEKGQGCHGSLLRLVTAAGRRRGGDETVPHSI